MPVSWITVLKAVPWGDVISNAPVVVDGARKLWNTVGRKGDRAERDQAGTTGESSATAGGSTQPAPVDAGAAMAGLQTRLDSTDTRLNALQDQMITSSELIKALAEQNGQLIARIDTMRRRGAWLGVAALLALVGALVAIALAWPGAR
jgi:chromosome segregation ATPase